MTASGLRSYSDGVGPEVPLQAFALNCCVPETLSKVVLGAVSASMASKATDGNDDLAVFLVVGKDLLEPITEVVEVLVLGHLRLEHAWLHCGGLRARERVIEAHTSTLLTEEVVCRGPVRHHVKRGWVTAHASLGRSWRVRLLHLDAVGEEVFAAHVRLVDVTAVVVVVLARNHLLVVSKASLVGEAVFVTLSGRETALGGVVDMDRVLLAGERGRYLGVGLGHGVAIDHSTDVASVAWHLLLANVVSGARNPVLRVTAAVAKNVFVHLSTRWQVNSALHALFESDSAHVSLIATAVDNLAINGARSLAKEVILERHMASVTRQVLAAPQTCLLRSVL